MAYTGGPLAQTHTNLPHPLPLTLLQTVGSLFINESNSQPTALFSKLEERLRRVVADLTTSHHRPQTGLTEVERQSR